MENCIRYSPRASLAIVGRCIQQMEIWKTIGQFVKIKQKTVKHTPVEKLQDAFINIMAGGAGIVEINKRVKTDPALSLAFGRSGCADQSGVSETLNQCQAKQVKQMQAANDAIYRKYGAGYAHHYGKGWQLLDIDMSGMPAGRQGQGVEKGYFANQTARRGRQLGRVYATLYDEIVYEQLFDGKTQLNRSLSTLLEGAEVTLNLNRGFRQRTIIRLDGGGGNIADINNLQALNYKFLVKVTHWKQVAKLAASVKEWVTDPKNSRRQAGWVETPYEYAQTTRQLAVRCLSQSGKWKTAVLVFNLDDEQLLWLHQKRTAPSKLTDSPLWQAVYNYDLRGGGVETSFRNSKQGLSIAKRNKKSVAAQQMLLLLGQLSYNLISWTRDGLAACVSKIADFGTLRMVRDTFHVSGKLIFNEAQQVIQISLNEADQFATVFIAAFSKFLARDGTVVNLRQI